jgi:hypothetical protein
MASSTRDEEFSAFVRTSRPGLPRSARLLRPATRTSFPPARKAGLTLSRRGLGWLVVHWRARVTSDNVDQPGASPLSRRLLAGRKKFALYE